MSIEKLVEECADCLESEVEARWRLPDGTIHPAQQRKYERDLEPVHKAREVLAALSSLRSPESAVGDERERCARVVEAHLCTPWRTDGVTVDSSRQGALLSLFQK